MASPGSRDTQITVQTSSVTKVSGIPTEVWTDVKTLWGGVEVRPTTDETINSLRILRPTLRLRFDWMDGQIITSATRLLVKGTAYEVRTLDNDTDRRHQVIVDVEAVVTDPSSAQAEWEKKMRRGEIVRIQDRSKSPIVETFVRAVSEFLQPEELASGITQGARRYFVMAEDVDESFGPIQRGHFVAIRDDRLFIESVDDSTYRYGGDLIVYALITRGYTNASA